MSHSTLLITAGVAGPIIGIWFYLLFRLHRDLSHIDPDLAAEIGRPSLFWSAFNSDVRLIGLGTRGDLADTKYAALQPQVRLIRFWALLFLGALAGLAWVFSTTA